MPFRRASGFKGCRCVFCTFVQFQLHLQRSTPDFSQLLPEIAPSLSLLWATTERPTPAGHRGGKTVQQSRGVSGSRQVHLALNPLPDSFSRIWKWSLCSESVHRETFFCICNPSCRIGVSICSLQKLVTSWWRFHCYVTSFHKHKNFATDRVLATHQAAKCDAISRPTATDQRYRPDKIWAL